MRTSFCKWVIYSMLKVVAMLTWQKPSYCSKDLCDISTGWQSVTMGIKFPKTTDKSTIKTSCVTCTCINVSDSIDDAMQLFFSIKAY